MQHSGGLCPDIVLINPRCSGRFKRFTKLLKLIKYTSCNCWWSHAEGGCRNYSDRYYRQSSICSRLLLNVYTRHTANKTLKCRDYMSLITCIKENIKSQANSYCPDKRYKK